MPPKYNYAGTFVGPMTCVFGNKTYYVDRIERSFEYSTLDGEAKEILEISAWKPAYKQAPISLPPDYSIKKIVCNGPATVVFWADGTKTVVKLAEGDKNDRRIALLYALAKKKFGNNSRIHKEIDPYATSNAQRIAILKYIIAKDGVNLDQLMNNLKLV